MSLFSTESKISKATPTPSPLLVPRAQIRSRGVSSSASLPKMLRTVPKLTHTFRFISSTATAEAVTTQTLLGALGVIGTSAVTAQCYCSSVKLNQIRIWPAASGTATVTWAAAEGREWDDTMDESIPTGITVSTCLTFSPPKDALASMVLNNVNTAALFSIASTVGSIVDVSLTFTLAANFSGPSITVVSAVLGAHYFLALDGPVSHGYTPIGLPTTL